MLLIVCNSTISWTSEKAENVSNQVQIAAATGALAPMGITALADLLGASAADETVSNIIQGDFGSGESAGEGLAPTGKGP